MSNMDFIIDNFDMLFDNEVNIKKLESIILDLAVKGKLVKQDENDEKASVLLKKIKAEKNRLIKEKKIKKPKILSEIREEEIPFEIPESWKWVRLGEVCHINSGQSPESSYYNDSKKGTPFYQGKADYGDKYLNSPRYWTTKITKIAVLKDIVISVRAPVGPVNIVSEKICIGRGLAGIRGIKDIYYLYLYYFGKWNENNLSKYRRGTTFNSITRNDLEVIKFPLPPLNEQKRIVKRIETLKKLIENLKEKTKNKEKIRLSLKNSLMSKIEKTNNDKELSDNLDLIFENFDIIVNNKKDVDDIRNLILSMAVKGKLVKQDENDEKASVLLKKIKTEKNRLIKEKKIKKPKVLPEITEEEIPFEIPESWEWVRLGEICQFNPRNSLSLESKVSFIPMKLIEDGYSNKHISEVKTWKDIKSGFTHFTENDVAISKITPCFQNRKSAVLKNLKNKCGAGTTELYILRSYGNLVLSEFILFIAKTKSFIDGGVATYTGTAGQQRVKKDFVFNFLIGLPPLKEQKRIVKRVENLMKYCDKLEEMVVKRDKDLRVLMDSLV